MRNLTVKEIEKTIYKNLLFKGNLGFSVRLGLGQYQYFQPEDIVVRPKELAKEIRKLILNKGA